MDLVVKEANGQVWHYENGFYYHKKGEDIIGILKGHDLPDPYVLWKRKCTAAGKEYGQPEGALYRPQEITFRLWEHWNNVNNNN